MSLFKYLLLLVLHFFIVSMLHSPDKKEFGPFDMKVISYIVKTNKQYQSDLNLKIELKQNADGSNALHIFVNVKKNLGVLGVKIKGYMWNDKDQNFVLAFNIAAKNFCSREIFKVVTDLIPGLGKDCTIKPNVYNFTIPNMQAFVRVLAHDVFYYGKYVLITEVRGAGRGLFVRINCTADMVPKV